MNKDNKLETHWKKYFDYRFMGSYSLEKDEEIVVEIESIGYEEIENLETKEVSSSLIAHFKNEGKGEIKPMFMGKASCKAIEFAYKTSDPNEWINKKIQLYIESGIKLDNGEIVNGLRVRNFVPTEISIYDEQTQRLINFINSCNSKTNLESVKKHCTIEYTENLYKTKIKTLK